KAALTENEVMPYTRWGTGTAYRGRREQAADGSYVTTEFGVVLYVPIFPFSSWRVLPVGQGKYSFTGITSSTTQEYQVVRVPLHWRQIANVYLDAAMVLVGIASVVGVVLALLYPRSDPRSDLFEKLASFGLIFIACAIGTRSIVRWRL